jgi:hypothetical protein
VRILLLGGNLPEGFGVPQDRRISPWRVCSSCMPTSDGGARLEVLNAATGWRIAATAIFVSLAWLPVMLPLWNRLPDLAAVYLRLFFVR